MKDEEHPAAAAPKKIEAVFDQPSKVVNVGLKGKGYA